MSNTLRHELLPWNHIMHFISVRRTLDRDRLLKTLEEEAMKREEQARGIRNAIAAISKEEWERNDER